MSNLYLLLLKLYTEEQPLVLATITGTDGSFLLMPGSTALFNDNGLIAGTIDDEIPGNKVQPLALQLLRSKKSGYFHFDFAKNNEESFCGGKVEILIETLTANSLLPIEKMKESLDLRTPGVLATTVIINGDLEASIERTWITERTADPHLYGDALVKEIKKLLEVRYPYSAVKLADHNRLVFLEPIFPPPQLIIAGAGHIGKTLSHFAKLLDFETTVIDDREAYANRYNLPDADHIISGNSGEVLEEMDFTRDTYIIIATRSDKEDVKALRPCIGSEAAYIGVVGSQNKISVMREEFMKKGWAEPREWKDIHALPGMDFQANTVQEIALNIAEELVLVKNGYKRS